MTNFQEETMGYELEEITLSQSIFYYLIEYRQLKEEDNTVLYKAYMENENVMELVKRQGTIANSLIERYGNIIYLIPDEDNYYLGYSKRELKRELCKSNGTDKDYYLSQFVILVLLVEFYDGQGSSSKARDYLRVGDLLNSLSDRLKEGVENSDEESEDTNGLAFSNMLEAFEALRSEEKGSRAKTTKEGFIYNILKFLQNQDLIDFIEEDEMIKTTKKLDQLMDYNLLNKKNYRRVLRVLGVEENE